VIRDGEHCCKGTRTVYTRLSVRTVTTDKRSWIGRIEPRSFKHVIIRLGILASQFTTAAPYIGRDHKQAIVADRERVQGCRRLSSVGVRLECCQHRSSCSEVTLNRKVVVV
jgi:hypothetical protein